MGLETTVNWIEDLNENWPLGSDAPSTLDNHDRHIKTALKNQLPNLGAEAVTKTAAEINDLATLTGTETLTNKTLTTPTVNTPAITTPTINGQPGYGLVFLDTPQLLVNAASTSGWTQMDMSTVYAQAAIDGAVAAMVSIRVVAGSASASVGSFACHLQKNGLGGSASNVNMRAIAFAPSAGAAGNDHASTIVTLDANSDFEYQLIATNSTTNSAFIYLLGYYV